MLDCTEYSVLSDVDPTTYCDHLTSYLNFCFDLWCPVETIFIQTDRFSSPLLKQLRRRKEMAYKQGLKSVVKTTTTEIKAEIRRLNHLYVKTVLGNKDCRSMWRTLKRLCGMSTVKSNSNIDIEQLTREFSHSSPVKPLLSNALQNSKRLNPVMCTNSCVRPR